MSAGGAPAVSVVGQTTIPPFALMSSIVTHGERSGVASSNRLGRPDAPNATRAAVRGSPATIGAGAADAALEAVAEKTRHGLGRLIDVEIDAEPRQRNSRQHGHDRRNEQQAEPGGDDGVLVTELDVVAGRDHDGKAGADDKRRDAADRHRPSERDRSRRSPPGRARLRRNRRTGGRRRRPGNRTITGAGSCRPHRHPISGASSTKRPAWTAMMARSLPQRGSKIIGDRCRMAQLTARPETARRPFPAARADAGP